MTTDDLSAQGDGPLKVTIHYPVGRELLWVTADSPVVSWEVGQAVGHRNDTWVVLSRTEGEESLAFTLGASE